MKRNSLTYKKINKLGLNNISHITADMLEGYTKIDDYAFDGCDSLISIEIPVSVTKIGWGAFLHCKNLTSITIPDSVTSIEDYAFCGCNGLTSVTIPSSVTSIGDCAFEGCTKLKSVNIPNSVTVIGYHTFSDCNHLSSVAIGNRIMRIERGAFKGCTKLKSVNIPNSIVCIEDDAFRNCTKLAFIIIGGIKYENQEVIDGKCKAYKAFHGDMTACRRFKYEEGKTYEIDGEPSLCNYGFHACLNLSDVFNYYCGELGKDIHIHEVELEGVSKERYGDSKIVGNKIAIGKRIA